MRKKLSISITKSTLELIDELVKEGSFRNKSHVVEYAVTRFKKKAGEV